MPEKREIRINPLEQLTSAISEARSQIEDEYEGKSGRTWPECLGNMLGVYSIYLGLVMKDKLLSPEQALQAAVNLERLEKLNSALLTRFPDRSKPFPEEMKEPIYNQLNILN